MWCSSCSTEEKQTFLFCILYTFLLTCFTFIFFLFFSGVCVNLGLKVSVKILLLAFPYYLEEQWVLKKKYLSKLFHQKLNFTTLRYFSKTFYKAQICKITHSYPFYIKGFFFYKKKKKIIYLFFKVPSSKIDSTRIYLIDNK